MYIWYVKKLNITIVCVLFLISFPCQHIPQSCIISSCVINFDVVLQIYFFLFTDKVWTFCNLTNHFLILLTSVTHNACFDLAATEDCCIAFWFVLIKVCQSWDSLSRSKFWPFGYFFFCQIKRNKKLWRIGWRNLKWVIFYYLVCKLELFLILFQAKILSCPLPDKLISNVVNFPSFLYLYLTICPLFLVLKSIQLIDSIDQGKLCYFLVKWFDLISEYVGKD